MDLLLTEDQMQFRSKVREFAKAEILPYSAEYDRLGEFPWATLKKMGEIGLLGIPIPKEYGGLGLDTISYLIGVEELSAACGSTGVITAVHTSVGTYPIYLFGTEEQKQKFVKPLAKGEILGAFALTEAEAGSDAAAIKATAVRRGGKHKGFVLNGRKIFITNGNSAGIVIVLAITDKSKDHKGISAFIVEKGAPGFKYGSEEQKMGLHASEATELVFENCEVPAENLLGEEGNGFLISMITLDGGRLGIAAQALCVARAAFEESLKYSKTKKQAGKLLYRHQNIQFLFADMSTKLEAARLLMYNAAFLKDQNVRYTWQSAMAKLYSTEVAMQIVNTASWIMGEFGYTQRSPMERYLRDVKVTEIYEGTSEIQRLIIAKQLLN